MAAGAKRGFDTGDAKPSALPLNAAGVPPELRALRQWVGWDYRKRDVKWDKPPLRVLDGSPASSTNPDTWETFDAAVLAHGMKDWSGVGFVFTASDPYCGVDLDDCRDPNTGAVEAWAEEIVVSLCSYTEISPSGTGLKIICRACLPTGRRKYDRVEVYDRGRYFTVTGQVYEGLRAIESRQSDVEKLIAALAAKRPAKAVPPNGKVHEFDRASLVARCRGYLATMPEPVSGNNGHDKLWAATLAALWGFRLTEDEARPLLDDFNARRCSPPWSERELAHKISDVLHKPHTVPYGWLADDPKYAHANGAGGNGAPPKKPATKATPAAADSQKGVDIIAAFFREYYRPVFRRGNAIYCEDGELIYATHTCSTFTSDLIERLARAADAPQYQGGGVNYDRLPMFFRNWARGAWGDVISTLPDEDGAAAGELPREEFRRFVREAMVTEVSIINPRSQLLERRSLIDWCYVFAKPGLWHPVRSKACWCKAVVADDGELTLMVSIRHELFSQLKADPSLRRLTANAFSRRATKYGVGESSTHNRPEGKSAVVLTKEFIADLLATPDESEG